MLSNQDILSSKTIFPGEERMKKILTFTAVTASLLFTACTTADEEPTTGTEIQYETPTDTTLSGDYTDTNILLTADKTWYIQGRAAFLGESNLKIEAGTTIAGFEGTGPNTSYLVISKDAKIHAEGTAAKPIIFTSYDAVEGYPESKGQWGFLVIIGKAGNRQVSPFIGDSQFSTCSDGVEGGCAAEANHSSGTLRYVEIRNAGSAIHQGNDFNSLNFVGVGSGTTVDHLKVVNAAYDCLAVWGGTVNLSDIYLEKCYGDHLDIDDGYSGTVTNLTINQTTGESAIEISGDTAATFENVTITQNASAKEGGIYFKYAGTGGHFNNVTITDNLDDGYGAIHSMSGDRTSDTVDINNTSFSHVTLDGTSTDERITGTSSATLTTKFDTGSGNIR